MNEPKLPPLPDMDTHPLAVELWELLNKWLDAGVGDEARETSKAVDAHIHKMLQAYATEAVRLNVPTLHCVGYVEPYSTHITDQPGSLQSKPVYMLSAAPHPEAQTRHPTVSATAFDRLDALNESNAARIIELEDQIEAMKLPKPEPQGNEADELLRNLGLDPDRYRTEGGAINHLKVKVAIRFPDDYPRINTCQHEYVMSAKFGGSVCKLCGTPEFRSQKQEPQQRCLSDVRFGGCPFCGKQDCVAGECQQQEPNWMSLYEHEKRRAEMWRQKYESVAGPDERAFSVAARAEPQGSDEPIHQWGKVGSIEWFDGHPDHEDGGGPYRTRTLFTRPQRKRLTDEEIIEVRKNQSGRYGSSGLSPYSDSIAFARAIEAAIFGDTK